MPKEDRIFFKNNLITQNVPGHSSTYWKSPILLNFGDLSKPVFQRDMAGSLIKLR